jgi:hypothetical protein
MAGRMALARIRRQVVTKGRQAFHNTIIGRDLRLLRRVIRRVPAGSVFTTMTPQGLRWDGHTGLFLRPRADRAAA